MKIEQVAFAGEAPKIATHLLPDGAASTAINCNLESGTIKPWGGLAQVATVSPTRVSIYRFGQRTDSSTQHWFSWDTDADVARGPFPDDTNERTYITQSGQVPRFTDATIALGASMPAATRALGVAPPVFVGSITTVNNSIIAITSTGTTAYVTLRLPHGYLIGETFSVSISEGILPTDYWTLSGVVPGLGGMPGTLFRYVTSTVATATGPQGFRYELRYAYTGNATVSTNEFRTGTVRESRAYAYSHVTDLNERGPLALIGSIDVLPGQWVRISGMAANSGKKRIFRADTNGVYRLLAEVPGSTTLYEDIARAEDLVYKEEATEIDWIAPPADMIGIAATPNGFLVGFSPALKSLCFSEPYQPHAWPQRYRLSFDSEPVAIGVTGASVLVMTGNGTHLVTATDPANASSALLGKEHRCVSKRSVATAVGGVYYASPFGLCFAGPGVGIVLVSDEWMSREQWQALRPESILGVYFDGRYFGFYDCGELNVPGRPDLRGKGGFIFDPRSKLPLTWLGFHAAAAYSDPRRSLFLQVAGNIMRWNADPDAPLTFTYRSREIVTPLTTFGASKVEANGPVSFRLQADNRLRHVKDVVTDRSFRLPRGYRARRWTYEVQGTAEVSGITIASTMSELR